MNCANGPGEISFQTLLQVMRDGVNINKRYCFILGAGASAASGIKSGKKMSKEWLEWIHENLHQDELRQRMDALGISEDALSEESRHYFDLFDLRFYGDYSAGYTYLRKVMENARPSFGYYHLAAMLANTKNNLILTTNFDTLTEDALSICTDKRPLVIDHEQLAQYTEISDSRPVVLQIHRGLYLEPFNRRQDMQALPDPWIRVLYGVFMTYVPIVVGYAGGDRSLMSFLKSPSVPLRGLYWCYPEWDPPTEEVLALVKNKGGWLVAIDGFDEMMFQLGEAFGHKSPVDRIRSVADSRVKFYQDENAKMLEKYSAIQAPTASQQQMLSSLENADEQAVRDLTAKIEKNPKNASLYVDRAIAFARLEQHDDAIADCTKAIALDPQEAAYTNRGNSYCALEQYDAAKADYDKAIDLNPESAAAYNNRGNAYSSLEQTDAAMADYDKAIELNPEYTDAYYNRGLLSMNLKQYDAAVADYSKTIELNPEYAATYNNRGYVYTRQKLYGKAMADVTKALQLDHEEPAHYVSRGRIHYEIKQYDAAVEDLNRAATLDPDIPNTYYWLGRTYAALGRNKMAEANLSKAKKLGYQEGDPDDPN